MRVACLLVGVLVVVGLGCDDGFVEQLLRGRAGGDQGGTIAVPLPDAGADGSLTGRGGAPDGATGGGGQGGAPGVACGPLSLSSTIVLAPAAAGQNYVRCQTLGPEAGWQVALSATGDRLAARTGAGTLRLIATDTWTEIAQLGAPLGAIDAVAFSPDGATLATLSAEMGEVALWSSADGTFQRSFTSTPASGIDPHAAGLAFSSDGGRLATSLGLVIDLSGGTTTGGQTPALNPENLDFTPGGNRVPLIRFVAADKQLLLETDYQVGNSPTSTRLALQDPVTGVQTVLYDFYSRGLSGYAVSPDGRFIAWAATAEAGGQGFPAGLTVFDATAGAQSAFAPSFAGSVLGFSRDSAQLFTATGTTVAVVGSSDLHAIHQFAVPTGFTFLGISPAGDLVGSASGATSWRSPATGAIFRSSGYTLTTAIWSADGRFGAGAGDPSALFHLWREADETQLCAPPADSRPAPALASLGTAGPAGENQSATSSDGSLTISSTFLVHTHAASYDALAVRGSATGRLLRQFGATPGTESIAISTPAGDRLFTPQGSDVAVWCR
jgi:WD40 repeat protein